MQSVVKINRKVRQTRACFIAQLEITGKRSRLQGNWPGLGAHNKYTECGFSLGIGRVFSVKLPFTVHLV